MLLNIYITNVGYTPLLALVFRFFFVTPLTPHTCSRLIRILHTNLGSNLHGVGVAVHATQLDTTFIADESLLKLGNKLHAAVGVVE